jgi:hypothetical protein
MYIFVLSICLYVNAFLETRELSYSLRIPPTPQTPTQIHNKADNSFNSKSSYHEIQRTVHRLPLIKFFLIFL